MNLFLKTHTIDHAEYSIEYIDLCVKRKYKNCINKVKYKDLILSGISLNDLIKLKIYKDYEIKDFLIKQFFHFKNEVRINRNLYKTFNKLEEVDGN